VVTSFQIRSSVSIHTVTQWQLPDVFVWEDLSDMYAATSTSFPVMVIIMTLWCVLTVDCGWESTFMHCSSWVRMRIEETVYSNKIKKGFFGGGDRNWMEWSSHCAQWLKYKFGSPGTLKKIWSPTVSWRGPSQPAHTINGTKINQCRAMMKSSKQKHIQLSVILYLFKCVNNRVTAWTAVIGPEVGRCFCLPRRPQSKDLAWWLQLLQSEQCRNDWMMLPQKQWLQVNCSGTGFNKRSP